ncbi:hypothetical protein [Pontibacter pamirensis]|uniref:hypothetical protein n=1 Tax=Pontibacter pamirensis TaxID=2562824 RepID=UPI001389C43F|nr:hypothetical protein [Pontibacter pamirensis]
MIVKIKDVFKTIGTPSITYVSRNDGEYERLLAENLDVSGKLCLITGPSKTGKSTLYQKVLADINRLPLIMRCDGQMTIDDVWRKALEDVNFDRITASTALEDLQVTGSAKVGGNVGWAWLAKLIGEVSLGISDKVSESIAREKIISKPSPKHLIPILKNLPYVLVIEDFHYLDDEVKKSLFQQWKAFVDEEVSVIVLGTTHHAVDLAYSNRDLVGRIAHIEIGTWLTSDIEKIITSGFSYLNVPIKKSLVKFMATECVGLPIITQSCCLRMFFDKRISEIDTKKGSPKPAFDIDDLSKSLYNVAHTDFSVFKDIYDVIIRGFRKGGQKYNSYELLLLIFTLDPITFKLQRHEIDERLAQLSLKFITPPATSINSTLGVLSKLQNKYAFELLEWSQKLKTLYILEPSFLFYLRWKEDRKVTDAFDTDRIERIYQIIFNDMPTKFPTIRIKS